MNGERVGERGGVTKEHTEGHHTVRGRGPRDTRRLTEKVPRLDKGPF